MQRKRQVDRLDLMQIHNLVDWRTHLATLRDWKTQGRIRYLGVTHYTAGAYREVEAVLLDVGANVDSNATNLVTGDGNGRKDVFVRDRLGNNLRVSATLAGGDVDGDSDFPVISGNGRFIALDMNHTGTEPRQVFVHQNARLLGDLNGDGNIGVADLLMLLANWCPDDQDPACGCLAYDLNGDGKVDDDDKDILIENWG